MRGVIGSMLIILFVKFAIGQQNGVLFENKLSWAAIKEKAKKEQKYIFIDCYATWCGPCKMMDNKVYTNNEVGAALNQKFISVKVQFDQTPGDNDYIRSWYNDAKALNEQYKIEALPTFLFFNPEGELIHRAAGFMWEEVFIPLVKFATDPKRKEYYNQLESYKKGEKDYFVLPEMIRSTREIFGDKRLAEQMAKDYIENFLKQIPPHLALTKTNLQFVGLYKQLMKSDDIFFQEIYRNKEKVNKIMHDPNWSEYHINYVVTHEELMNKLMSSDSTYKIRVPEWKALTNTIHEKYPEVDAEKIVREYKNKYYTYYYTDPMLWAQAVDESLKFNKPNLRNWYETIYVPYNNQGAWHAFLNYDDYNVLNKSLEWINTAIEFLPDSIDNKHMYVDTKAAVLYKMGKVNQAVKVESSAIELVKRQTQASPDVIAGYEKIIEQMRARKPIYQEEAKWGTASLERIKKSSVK